MKQDCRWYGNLIIRGRDLAGKVGQSAFDGERDFLGG